MPNVRSVDVTLSEPIMPKKPRLWQTIQPHTQNHVRQFHALPYQKETANNSARSHGTMLAADA
jgi:hypothetical protein